MLHVTVRHFRINSVKQTCKEHVGLNMAGLQFQKQNTDEGTGSNE